MPDDPGCDLFVDAPEDPVRALLAAHLGVEPVYGDLRLAGAEVAISRNPLAEPRGEESDHFPDWPTLVEVSAEPGHDLAAFVADLTTALRSAGHRVVAVP